MKCKLHSFNKRGILILFLVLCNLFTAEAQCEPDAKGTYYVEFVYGPYKDNVAAWYDNAYTNPDTGESRPEYMIFQMRLIDEWWLYETDRGSFNDKISMTEVVDENTPVGAKLYRTLAFQHKAFHRSNNTYTTQQAINRAKRLLDIEEGFGEGRCHDNTADNLFVEGFCGGKGYEVDHTKYVTFGGSPSTEFINADDMEVKQVMYYDALTNEFTPVYNSVDGFVNQCDIDYCTSYLRVHANKEVLNVVNPGSYESYSWDANNRIDFTQAFIVKDHLEKGMPEEEKAKVKWYVQDLRDRSNIINYEIPEASLTSFDLYSISGISQMGTIGIKVEYECANGSLDSDFMRLRLEACSLSGLSLKPSDYLKEFYNNPGNNDTYAWNADDAFDFIKAFELKDQDGNLLSEEDLEKVKWYVEDRSKTDDKFIYVNPEDPYNTPEEYYFSSIPNVDQWGELLIRAEYTCDDGTIVHTMNEIEVLDIGMYFRNPSGDILRWHKNLYEKDPNIYNGFYDPSKNIVMHSHGWQPGENAKHKLNPSGNPVRERLGEDGIDSWHDNYNVLLFFWTQSADHINGVTPDIVNFIEPSKRAFKRNPKWIRENGTESLVATSLKSIGKICGEQVKEIITTTGFNNEAREVRLVGHSFGALVVTRATKFLSTLIVDRMVYLDPATTAPFLTYYKDKIMPNPSIMPPTEWYQSSAYDLAWQPSSFFISGITNRDVYNTLISNTTYVRIHPLWEPGYPVGDGILHGSAREHYYKSYRDSQPMVVEAVEPDVPEFGPEPAQCFDGSAQAEHRYDLFFEKIYYANPLATKCFVLIGPRIAPSAAASLEDLALYKGKALEQVHGVNTVSTNDDGYALRNPDTDGNHVGQEYYEVDLSLEAIIDTDNVVLSWENNNRVQQRSLSKSQSASPSYYVILDQDLKGIGFTSEHSYTVEDITPDTSYEFYVLPIGSDGYPTGYDKVEARTYDPLPIALGTVNNYQADESTWHEVTFSSPMYNPSVVFGPASYDDEEPVTIRVKDVTNFGFKYQFDEWDYQDGSHSNETISYIAISQGVNSIGGLITESGVVADVNHRYKSVDFNNEFTTKPIVFTQVSSFEEDTAVITRVKNVSTTGFELRVQEEEGNYNSHANELISYIAIESGIYRFSNGLTIIVGSDTFNHNFKSINFSSIENPAIVASMQTTNGGDPTGLRYRDLSTSSVQLKLEEEQSHDSEVWHANEEVGYLIYGMESIENASRASKIASTHAVFKLFPNPTTGKIFLNSELDIKKATILDIHGRVLQNIEVMNKNQEIDVSTLKTGMYILKVITNQNEEKNFTFIKS